MRHTMHLRLGVAKQPNLELKTWPKQLLVSLPLVIALPVLAVEVGTALTWSACLVSLATLFRLSSLGPVPALTLVELDFLQTVIH
jgi:hypothetical protein